MKLAEHKDLKASILELPVKEKDKLLLRLIAKDKILTEHLHFKLLESDLDLEDRKLKIKADTQLAVIELKQLTTKEALAKIRKMISSVNHFYKVTKDNYGEIELKIYILNEIPISFKREIVGYKDFAMMFATYYIKTVQITLNKFYKLHEDLQFDLSGYFNELLTKTHQSKLAYYAEEFNLPKQID